MPRPRAERRRWLSFDQHRFLDRNAGARQRCSPEEQLSHRRRSLGIEAGGRHGAILAVPDAEGAGERRNLGSISVYRPEPPDVRQT